MVAAGREPCAGAAPRAAGSRGAAARAERVPRDRLWEAWEAGKASPGQRAHLAAVQMMKATSPSGAGVRQLFNRRHSVSLSCDVTRWAWPSTELPHVAPVGRAGAPRRREPWTNADGRAMESCMGPMSPLGIHQISTDQLTSSQTCGNCRPVKSPNDTSFALNTSVKSENLELCLVIIF